MKLSQYNAIISEYRQINKRSCVEELSSFFPEVSMKTLESIVFQEYQRKMKRFHYLHSNPDRIAHYYRQYKEAVERGDKSGFLVEIADKVDFSPSLMARCILDKHYSAQRQEGESVSRQYISELLRNTTLIDDSKLAAEIYLCTLYDENYGPIADVIRRSIGQEYEQKLKSELHSLGITFVDETVLREKGYDKTPDVKLEIPIAIEGRIVNWIESKASFGDEGRHKEYLKEQYWSYFNRFGPGLVVYWFGFIEELNIHKDQGILLSDTIPSNITFMNPLSLTKI